MSPIVRHGYVSAEEKSERQKLYNSTAWKRTRQLIRERDGNACRFCGTSEGWLDVAHSDRTQKLIDHGAALDFEHLFTACRRCHTRFSLGHLSMDDLKPLGPEPGHRPLA